MDKSTVTLEIEHVVGGKRDVDTLKFSDAFAFKTFLDGFSYGKNLGSLVTKLTFYESTAREIDVPGGAAKVEEITEKPDCDCDYGTAHCPHKSVKKLVVKK